MFESQTLIRKHTKRLETQQTRLLRPLAALSLRDHLRNEIIRGQKSPTQGKIGHNGERMSNEQMAKKMAVFWEVAPCNLVEIDRRFKGAYCLHH
jgi:hypothetical protein